MRFSRKLRRFTSRSRPFIAEALELRLSPTAWLWLNFDGGIITQDRADSITLPDNDNDATTPAQITMPKFDLSALGFGGQEETVINNVLGFVREDYAAYDLHVALDPPFPEPYTTVYIGGSPALIDMQNLFGIASTIDQGNVNETPDGTWDPNKWDIALVFPEQWSLGGDNSTNMTVQEFSEQLAEVVSHEAAHTFGLRHLENDPHSIMSATAPPDVFISFGIGDLQDTTEETGEQDSAIKLGQNLDFKDTAELNHGTNTATATPLPANAHVEGVLRNWTDVDFFQLAPTTNTNYTIALHTDGFTNLDPFVGVLDTDGNLLTNTLIPVQSSGITVFPSGGLVTMENGAAAGFVVVLNSQPSADVAIGLSSSDLTEGTVTPASLTFTSANWNTPQVVTVTGVDDALADGDISYFIVTAPAVSTDTNYSGRDAADVSVTNLDHQPGITVTPTSGLQTNENGTTSTFSIVLNAVPSANVIIGLTSDNTTEGAVAPTSVTFTPANWNTPQTVTVTGVDDGNVDGSVSFNIVTAAATSTDANYNGIDPDNVAVINHDNDVAGINVTPVAGLSTTETGGTATFTVTLNSQPTADVTIALSSSDTSEGTVAPAAITFTAANWNTPQTVTITGVDDVLADGDISYSIVTAPAVSTDANYSGRDAANVSVINLDHEPGFTVAPTSGLQTNETGATSTFTVVLNAAPTADVAFSVSTNLATEGTASVSLLVFTSTNWDTPQPVTVTGVNDAIADGNIPYSIVTGIATSADPNYNGINPDDVTVINNDNENTGITVSQTTGLITTENSGTAAFKVVLNTAPTADVAIALGSSDTTEGAVSASLLVFTSTNWNIQQTVTINGVDDSVIDGNIAFSITTFAATSADANYNGLDPANVSVTNTDNESAGITISPVVGLSTTESGGTASFTVVLTAAPTADVTIPLFSSDATEGTVSPSTITFTPANWNTPQTVTITGVDDVAADGNVTYLITIGAATSTDITYSGLDATDVTVTNLDNENAGITVSHTSNLATTEIGGTATFSVVLNTAPTANVTIPLSSTDTTEGTVVPASLTFTPANWNTPQTVTVTGVEDLILDGNVAFDITTAPATSTDPAYNNRDASNISLTNQDNEFIGISVNPTFGLLTTESGGTASFTVVLNAPPTADVTVAVSSSNTNEGTVAPASLTFTSANWNTQQTVTVTGSDDDAVDGAVSFTIITGTAVSADLGYSGINPDDVAVANLDDDASVADHLSFSATAGQTYYVAVSGAGGESGARSFEGLDVTDTSDVEPPDTHLAAGPDHLVEVVNTAIAFFDKDSGTNLFTQELATFFLPTGPSTKIFDPVVTYDEQAGRFIVVTLDLNESLQLSSLLLAVSNTSDPQQGFTEMHRIFVAEPSLFGPESTWGDYPKLGWNADAVVVSLNMFTFLTDFYDHTSIVSFDKSTLLDGNPTTVTFFDVNRDATHFTMAAAPMHGSVTGDPMWFVAEGLIPGTVTVTRMTNVLSAAPVFTDFPVLVPAYDSAVPPTDPGGELDPGIDSRMLNADWRGTRLVAAHQVAIDDQTVARWYEFNTAIVPILLQSGDIFPPTSDGATYYPSVAVAANGDIGLTFIQSSDSEEMSMYVTRRGFLDPFGSMDDPTLVKAGLGNYGGDRAGDYSGIATDPVTGSTFWAANQYALAGSGANWGTWIASFPALPNSADSRSSGSYSLEISDGLLTPNLIPTATLAFGNVQLGQKKTLNLLLTNTGNETLDLSAITITSPFTLATPISISNALDDLMLEPGQSATLAVTYQPTLNAPQNGTITFTSNDTSAPVVALSGAGTNLIQSGTNNRSFTFTDQQGRLVTVKYSGPGNAAISFTNSNGVGVNIETVTFTGATASSKWSVAAATPTDIGTITIPGAFGPLKLTANVDTLTATGIVSQVSILGEAGNVTLAGTTKLTFGSLDGNVVLNNSITSFRINGTASGTISVGPTSAANVGTFSFGNTVDAAIVVNGSISSLRATGTFVGSLIASAGLGSLRAANLDLTLLAVGYGKDGIVGGDPDVGGSLTLAQSLTGDFLADTLRINGTLGRLASAGRLGDAGNTITVNGAVNQIQAVGNINSNISAAGFAISKIITASPNRSVDGALNGSVTAAAIQSVTLEGLLFGVLSPLPVVTVVDSDQDGL